MTRINCIPPAELTRAHLVAEYREIGRVFALVRRAIERGERPGDKRNPTAYTLGTGHVRFFYSRLEYIHNRFLALVAEMRSRGYRPQYDTPPDAGYVPAEWWGGWEPDAAAMTINRARIAERLGK